MQIIEDARHMQEVSHDLLAQGKRIALVSTNGALHAGHSALIQRARELAEVVVVSAFVNPKEFGPNEDYRRYPRCSAEDAVISEKQGVDILFRPDPTHFYPKGFSTYTEEESISKSLCGISRPHYFKGVCTLHVLLLNIIRPQVLVVGWRDAQKAAVLSKLITECHFAVSLERVETVRDSDGLPFNARNEYLNDFQRRDAATINAALLEGKKLVDNGIRNVDRVLAEVTHHIAQVRRLRVIYVAAVDPYSMQTWRYSIEPGKTLVMAAVWCDEVRLIDNLLL
jgi:pantoate--beta-alanine ligase